MRIVELSAASDHHRGSRWPAGVGRLLDQVEPASKLAGSRPHELSGGQRQRVAIARALDPHTQMLLSSAPGPGWQPERVAELRPALALTEGH